MSTYSRNVQQDGYRAGELERLLATQDGAADTDVILIEDIIDESDRLLQTNQAYVKDN
jgi:hypoxanthine-guanine phosphoribosyltransferase